MSANKHIYTRKSLTALLVLFCIFPASIALSSEPYGSPMKSPAQVTSTLGEYRGDHLHNGIDVALIKNGNRDVVAVEDGVVETVFYDPLKYGKTVIIRHKDGRKSWYSHLMSISPEILDSLDQPLEPGKKLSPTKTFEVDRSRTIGRMGQSGSGPTHLHFALQNSSGTFINPIGRFEGDLYYNPEPHINSLRMIPMGQSSWVDGKPGVKRFNELPRSTVRVWGKIALSINIDNSQPGSNSQSLPESITLFRDGDTATNVDFSRLPRATQKNETRRYFDDRLSNINPTRFEVLLNSSGGGPWEPLIFSKSGHRGTLRIEVKTATGDRVTKTVSYKAVPPPMPYEWFPDQITDSVQNSVNGKDVESIKPSGNKFLVASLKGYQTALDQFSPPRYESNYENQTEVELTHEMPFNRLQFDVNIDGFWKGWPRLTVRQNQYESTPSLLQVEPGHFVSWWKPELNRDGWHNVNVQVETGNGSTTLQDRIYLQSLLSGKAGAVVSMDQKYTLYSNASPLNVSSFVRIDSVKNYQKPSGALEITSTPRRILPSYLQASDSMFISAEINSDIDDPNTVGLYRWNPISKSWNRVSYRSGILKATKRGIVHGAGIFTLMQDRDKPEITLDSVQSSKHLAQFRITENGSGISQESISIKIDGRKIQHFRWDFERQLLRIPHRTNLPDHPVKVKVQCTDHAGREARWSGMIKP
ncbi:MAG: peptidoglycan DD-metalloendopeptidase family protein [bacterium]